MGNHLFVIFAVLDVSCAVNSCINQFFYIYNAYKRTEQLWYNPTMPVRRTKAWRGRRASASRHSCHRSAAVSEHGGMRALADHIADVLAGGQYVETNARRLPKVV